MSSILGKLEARDRTHAVAIAVPTRNHPPLVTATWTVSLRFA